MSRPCCRRPLWAAAGADCHPVAVLPAAVQVAQAAQAAQVVAAAVQPVPAAAGAGYCRAVPAESGCPAARPARAGAQAAQVVVVVAQPEAQARRGAAGVRDCCPLRPARRRAVAGLCLPVVFLPAPQMRVLRAAGAQDCSLPDRVPQQQRPVWPLPLLRVARAVRDCSPPALQEWLFSPPLSLFLFPSFSFWMRCLRALRA